MLSARNDPQKTGEADRASALRIARGSLWGRRARTRRRRLNDPRLWLRLLLLLAVVWLFESAIGRPDPAGAADHDGATAREKPDHDVAETGDPLGDTVHSPGPEHGQAAEGGHGGPATDVFLAVLLILFLAKNVIQTAGAVPRDNRKRRRGRQGTRRRTGFSSIGGRRSCSASRLRGRPFRAGTLAIVRFAGDNRKKFRNPSDFNPDRSRPDVFRLQLGPVFGNSNTPGSPSRRVAGGPCCGRHAGL